MDVEQQKCQVCLGFGAGDDCQCPGQREFLVTVGAAGGRIRGRGLLLCLPTTFIHGTGVEYSGVAGLADSLCPFQGTVSSNHSWAEEFAGIGPRRTSESAETPVEAAAERFEMVTGGGGSSATDGVSPSGALSIMAEMESFEASWTESMYCSSWRMRWSCVILEFRHQLDKTVAAIAAG